MSFGRLVGQTKTPRLANNEVNNRYRHRKAAIYRTQDKCIKYDALLQTELPIYINIFKKKILEKNINEFDLFSVLHHYRLNTFCISVCWEDKPRSVRPPGKL